MENFKKQRSKELIDTHKITCKAGGTISRMTPPADEDLLDNQLTGIQLAKTSMEITKDWIKKQFYQDYYQIVICINEHMLQGFDT